jgi:protein gp37
MSTGIQWTDETWNPVVGCEQVSPGCAHCYAKELHDRRHKAHPRRQAGRAPVRTCRSRWCS